MRDKPDEPIFTKKAHDFSDGGHWDKLKCYKSLNRATPAVSVELSGKWVGFPYMYLRWNIEYTPHSKLIVPFGDGNDLTLITIEGRCLEQLYNLLLENKIAKVRSVDRDNADDGQLIVTKITVEEVASTFRRGD